MMRILCFIIFLSTGLCQIPAPGVLDDLIQIYNTGTVNLINCAGTEVLLSNIHYTLYTQQNQQTGIPLDSTNLDQVNPNYPVTFIIHGWLQSGSQSWIQEMKSAYFSSTPNINIIVVDWSAYSGINYAASYCSVPQVGKYTGDLIYNITITPGIDLSKVQINGFSLGAQVGGYAGQEVQSISGSKIWRINGLDAAGPGYNGLPANQRLDASDAIFVQGIHSSRYQFGYNDPFGTVDFDVNYVLLFGCGQIQRGCPLYPGVPSSNDLSVLLPYCIKILLEPSIPFEKYYTTPTYEYSASSTGGSVTLRCNTKRGHQLPDNIIYNRFHNKRYWVLPCILHVFCNHIRAAIYFIESITSANFLGVSCSSCATFGLEACKFNPTVVMGEQCPSTASGVKYLNTNLNSPFAMGTGGI